ncbi:MAG: hypothetical protein JXA11_11720 [Phycisphaerae bacterium]|nr:hypothetical protein [Phycisphaerae bacterium]
MQSMHWIDWLIVVCPLMIVGYIALRAQRYVKGVSDFLTAGRVAGRYVLSVAAAEAGMGVISMAAMFESNYNSGFAYGFWKGISMPILVILSLMGYCIYRFRETRAMTMGQFFEIRYNKSFRIFAAVLQSISGILNYAIFPAVSARFLVYYCDFPTTLTWCGWEFQTFGLIMALFLTVAVVIVTLGGQITIMVTDCVQGILSYPMYLVIVVFLVWKFSWFHEMAPTLLDRPPGKSLLNPFDIEKLRNFNIFYVFVGIMGSLLNRMSWSGAQGYQTAAATPHEQKMGGVLGAWRGGFSMMMYVLLAVSAFTLLHHAKFAPEARKIRSDLARKAMNDVTGSDSRFRDVRADVEPFLRSAGKIISPALQQRLDRVQQEDTATADASTNEKKDNPPPTVSTTDAESILTVTKNAIQSEDKGVAQSFETYLTQMRVPTTLRSMFPIGITGVFCAMAIFLLISTDTTYLHSWGSIVVQDVVLPFREKPFTPRRQLFLLRLVIAFVAVFAFFFSYYFGQVDFIFMYFAITGAIYLGGAGPCIVGGLYWKRGTAVGAFAAMISGSILAISGILGQKYWVDHIYPWLVDTRLIDAVRMFVEGAANPFRPIIDWRVTPDKFPINSQEIYFITMTTSLTLYVTLSLLTCRKPFNMERMLHRGKYQVEGRKRVKEPWTPLRVLRSLLGIDDQYTRGDKILAWSVFLWTFGWQFGCCFIGIVLWNTFLGRWPNEWWANWFFINNVVIAAVIGLVSTVWFTIGGTWDLRRMFKRLAEKETNILDDGRVIDHVSVGDVSMVEQVDHVRIPQAEHALEEESKRETEEDSES